MISTNLNQTRRCDTGYRCKTIAFATIFCCIFFQHASAQNDPPGRVVKYNTALTSQGYVLFAPLNSNTTYLIGKSGNIVHTWASSFKPAFSVYLFPNGSLLRAEYNDCNNPFGGGQLSMYAWDGSLTWRYNLCNDSTYQSHDIYPMPDGNILVDVWEKIDTALARKMGMKEAILKQMGSPFILSAKVVELKPGLNNTASIVWQWRFWDHLDSTGTNVRLLNINDTGTPCCGNNDWIHMNAVTYNEKLNQVMVSSRNLNEIYIIDHSTTTQQAAGHTGGKQGMGGDFLYRWGNPAAYGAPGPRQLFGQHSPYWLDANGTQIMINNDGYGRDTTTEIIICPPINKSGNYTRVQGTAYGPAKPEWTYTAPDSLFNRFMGNGQRLPNGNTLICAAGSAKMPPVAFYEIDSKKNIVWDYHLSAGSNAFRCTLYACNYLKPGLLPEQSLQKK